MHLQHPVDTLPEPGWFAFQIKVFRFKAAATRAATETIEGADQDAKFLLFEGLGFFGRILAAAYGFKSLEDQSRSCTSKRVFDVVGSVVLQPHFKLGGVGDFLKGLEMVADHLPHSINRLRNGDRRDQLGKVGITGGTNQ